MSFLKKLFESPKDKYERASKEIDENSKARAKEIIFENEKVICFYDGSIEFKSSGQIVTEAKKNRGGHDSIKFSSGYANPQYVKWDSPKFDWIYNGEFKQGIRISSNGNQADFSLEFTEDGEIVRFDSGIWQSGAFKEGRFLRSEFNGGTFEGGDFSYDSNWNISPHYFISGVISEKLNEGDIQKFLGVEIAKDEKEWNEFNILSLPENLDFQLKIDFDGGFYLVSHIEKSKKENYGTTYTMEHFSYIVKKVKIKNGVNFMVEERVVKCGWENIRCDSVEYHNQNTIIKVGELLDLPFLSLSSRNCKISSILTTKETFTLIPDFSDEIELLNKTYFVDLDGKEDFDRYMNLKNSFINNDIIYDSLFDLSTFKTMGLVDGYGNYNGLSFLLDQGTLLDGYEIDERINEGIFNLMETKNLIINNLGSKSEREHLVSNMSQFLSNPNELSFNYSVTIDLAKDPRFGFTKEIQFGAYSEETISFILDFKEKIESGDFYNTLNKIKKQITNEVISGGNKLPGFKDILPNTEDPNIDSKLLEGEMKTLSNFLCFVAPRIKESNEKEAMITTIKLMLKDI